MKFFTAAALVASASAFMPEDAIHLNVFAARAQALSDCSTSSQAAQPSSLGGKGMKLIRNMEGSTFFDNWDFFSEADPTHGQVNYLDRSTAMRASNPLAYVENNHVFLKVDDQSWLASGANRDSVRITSKIPFVKGQLLALTVKHMPTGCTTWPAFWTVGPNWPAGGEIDIVEGVNLMSQAQYTLHTSSGCQVQEPMNATGTILTTDCDVYANGNVGCGIQDPRTASFGAAANAKNGGAYVTLWNDEGISIWFFPAAQIPWDLRRARPMPSTWGKPVAFWSTETCDTDTYFGNQTIVINTTLNGDWAGAASVYSAGGCSGSPSDFVSNPNHYKEAYWEIGSVRVYE